MIYFTLEFAITLLVFLLLYWGILHFYGKKVQNISILFFNYIILLWINPYFALVVGIYTMCIYLMGLLLCAYNSKVLLSLCLALCVLNLAFFKYFTDIKDSFDTLFAWFGLNVVGINLLFPLGISFYTFASITYLCTTYRTRQHESLSNVAIFLSFFPTFISGPIIRSDNFFSQLHKKRVFQNTNLIIILILFGITKKVFLANYLQIYSDPILENPTEYSSLSLLLGIYAYSVRLYCDFSGYVDLVSAFGLMLGFKLPCNFNMPYMASNIKDFWARWHITLSHFIRDYIYIPLGGNRHGFFLTQVFVLISFGLSGIWHGNTLNFFIWGLLHGFATIIFNICRYYNVQLPKYINTILTFHFVAFAWIFFYYSSFNEALLYLQSFYLNISKPFLDSEVIWFFMCCLFFFVYPFMQNFQRQCVFLLSCIPWILQPFVVSCCIILIIGFSPSGIPSFIYAGF